jgi:hypothetical protein
MTAVIQSDPINASDLSVLTVTLGNKSGPQAISVPTTAGGIILAAADTSRYAVLIYNVGPNTIYLGRDNTVTTATGYPVPSGSSFVDTISGDAWYAIAVTGACDVRIITIGP